MRAVIVEDQQPVLVERTTPTPTENEIVVQVAAASLNRADLLQVAGMYPPPEGASDVLGMEFAGTVMGVGDAVTDVQIGDRVMALVEGGAYAEQAVAVHYMPVPAALTDVEAAAIPEAFLTAYSNMVELGQLIAGQKVLIHAGASGVGLAAIQIAKQLHATVIVTASAAKHAVCVAHGADMVIDYKTQNFADEIIRAYGSVDLVVDMIGAPYWDDNVRVLAKWGRLSFIGLMGGASTTVNFGHIMRKRLTITGATLRDRTPERKAALVGRFWKWAMPLFKTGALSPTVWKTFPLDAVVQAHETMRENQNAGKIVLTMNH